MSAWSPDAVSLWFLDGLRKHIPKLLEHPIGTVERMEIDLPTQFPIDSSGRGALAKMGKRIVVTVAILEPAEKKRKKSA